MYLPESLVIGDTLIHVEGIAGLNRDIVKTIRRVKNKQDELIRITYTDGTTRDMGINANPITLALDLLTEIKSHESQPETRSLNAKKPQKPTAARHWTRAGNSPVKTCII